MELANFEQHYFCWDHSQKTVRPSQSVSRWMIQGQSSSCKVVGQSGWGSGAYHSYRRARCTRRGPSASGPKSRVNISPESDPEGGLPPPRASSWPSSGGSRLPPIRELAPRRPPRECSPPCPSPLGGGLRWHLWGPSLHYDPPSPRRQPPAHCKGPEWPPVNLKPRQQTPVLSPGAGIETAHQIGLHPPM